MQWARVWKRIILIVFIVYGSRHKPSNAQHCDGFFIFIISRGKEHQFNVEQAPKEVELVQNLSSSMLDPNQLICLKFPKRQNMYEKICKRLFCMQIWTNFSFSFLFETFVCDIIWWTIQSENESLAKWTTKKATYIVHHCSKMYNSSLNEAIYFLNWSDWIIYFVM